MEEFILKLFPGEKLSFNVPDDTNAVTPRDEDLNTKYVQGDVRIVTEQARYPLPSIRTMLASGNYKLNPDFQRRHRWDTEKQSRLIESFIMNVPIPPVFLYEDSYSHYEVMDGLQRLTAINDFYNDKLELQGLIEWRELNGRKYSQLPDQVRRGVDRRYLSSIILLHETAKSDEEADRLKQLVFERLNSGGVKLEAQESRNAIYDGPLNRLCIKLARNKHLCRAWGIPPPDDNEVSGGEPARRVLLHPDFRKMKDVELVLRFFAYRQRLANQRGSLEDYLDQYLKLGNAFKPTVLSNLGTLFSDTISLVHRVFGDRAFLLYRLRGTKWNWYQRRTTVVYDPMMCVFSNYIDRRMDILAQKRDFRDAIVKMYKSNYDEFEGRYTNLSNMSRRNELFDDLVTSVIGK